MVTPRARLTLPDFFFAPRWLAPALAFTVCFASRTFGGQLIWQGFGSTWDTTSLRWNTPEAPGTSIAWINGSDALFPSFGGTLSLTANITAQSLTFSNGGYTLNRIGSNTLTLAGFASISTDSSFSTTTISAPIAGSSGLTKNGIGTLSLTGANTYTGATIINSGTLTASNLPDTTAVFVQGGATYNASTDTIDSLSGSGTVSLGGTLTLGGTSAYTEFFGQITGSGGLNKAGTGELRLASASLNYTGATTITSGTLSASDLPDTTAVTLGSAGTYQVISPDTIGSLAGSGILNLVNNVLTIGANDGSTTFSGQIQGFGGGLKKIGSGTFTLDSFFYGYFGDLDVSGGTLRLGHSNALSSGTRVSLGSSGTFDLGGNFQTIASLSGTGQVVLGSGGNLSVSDSIDATFSGTFSGSGIFSKLGSNLLTLAGNNPFYFGTTSVQSGRAHVTGNWGSSFFNVFSNGTLSGNGTTGQVVIDSGGTISPGPLASPGTLTSSSATWRSGGSYVWEINQASGVAGANWDLLTVNGSLNLTATSGNPFHLTLQSLDPGNARGQVINFNSAVSSSYTFATANGSILGFNPSAFTIDTTGFANPFTGAWSVALNGNNLNLVYTAIPEPATTAALAGIVVLAVVHWRRRKRA